MILLETTDGNSRTVRITNKRVIDTRRISLAHLIDAPSLTLVMPYPFDSADPGPLCYVVTAVTDTP